jgi:hypothetical protein
MHSVPITTDVVSSNLDQGEVYNIMWLATGQWFSLGPLVSFTNKTEHHDITEILLKVALNTIKQTMKLSTCKKNQQQTTYLYFSNGSEIHYEYHMHRLV